MYSTELTDNTVDAFDTGDTFDAEPARPPYRREFYLTVLIMVFTMVQIWAFMVVLITMRPTGPALLAMGLTLSGATVAVVNGWRYILRRSRTHISRL